MRTGRRDTKKVSIDEDEFLGVEHHVTEVTPWPGVSRPLLVGQSVTASLLDQETDGSTTFVITGWTTERLAGHRTDAATGVERCVLADGITTARKPVR